MRSPVFDQASVDQRFSIAVAAFGQKLRDADQTAKFGYDKIIEIATAARGSDPFGYRAEFLSLVRLASALEAETGSGNTGSSRQLGTAQATVDAHGWVRQPAKASSFAGFFRRRDSGKSLTFYLAKDISLLDIVA